MSDWGVTRVTSHDTFRSELQEALAPPAASRASRFPASVARENPIVGAHGFFSERPGHFRDDEAKLILEVLGHVARSVPPETAGPAEERDLLKEELRSTVSQLTTENRRLRKSTDNSSDESTTAATMSSTPDPNSKKKAKFALRSSVSDPYLNSEVLPEISDLELEARRRVALGQSMSPVNRSDTPTEGFLLMHFWRDEGMRKSRSDRKSLAVPPPSSMSTSMPMRVRPTMKGAALGITELYQGVEMGGRDEILKNYLKTWFLIDVLTLGPDWTLEIMAYATAASGTSSDGSVGTSGSESMRLLRVFRVVRVARLLRLLKVKWLLETIGDAIPMSDYTSIVATLGVKRVDHFSPIRRVAQMMAILLYLNHVIACVFFATTTLGSYKTSWTDRYVALHWSLTQFTPAAMDVQPQNPLERAYTISVVIFALVGFSYVVGDISSCLTQLRNMSETSSKEFRKLRNFMRMHNVPRQLALRVTKFAEHAYSKQREARSEYVQANLDWVTEPALWLSNWEHLGTAEALGESVLISINAETFKKVVAHSNPAYIRVIQIYARRFLVWINEVPLHELSDVFQKELIEPQIRSFVPDGMLLGRSPSADLSH
eukprot:g27980.t1